MNISPKSKFILINFKYCQFKINNLSPNDYTREFNITLIIIIVFLNGNSKLIIINIE